MFHRVIHGNSLINSEPDKMMGWSVFVTTLPLSEIPENTSTLLSDKEKSTISIQNCSSSVKNVFGYCVGLGHYMSHLMRKPTICICENKDADQLRSNRKADQRLCFRYMDSTIPLFKSEISSF